jgi:beta-phosphoglucomutase-like phosphatase (HAD superfamily)
MWLFIFLLPLFLFAEIKAIIFDCDGTLVDSEMYQFTSWQRAVRDFGSDLTPEQWHSLVGNPSLKIVELLAQVLQIEANDLLARKREYYHAYLRAGFPPIEGTVELVRNLGKEKERLGLKMAVASAASKSAILENLRNLGIKDLFDFILSGQQDLSHYNDPEGVNTAITAGCITFAVPNDCTRHQDLSHATLRIETLAGISVEEFLRLGASGNER